MTGAGECWLCARPLGRKVELHHPVPKSRGGRDTVPLHPICHRTLHYTFDNKALAAIGANRSAIVGHPEIARFLGWIERKPPNFHAPTRRRR